MRNVAARVKAARELAKRLAAEEEGEADARGGVLGEGLSGDGGGFTGSQYIETEHGGDVDAAAAALNKFASDAAVEAQAAEEEANAFAARAVTEMDEAVTRIRQEAAKRVASAERERDKTRESAKKAIAEANQRASQLEETLRLVKTETDAKIRAEKLAQARSATTLVPIRPR